MTVNSLGWDDTIVALATPPGIGAIGVIRLSGSKTFEIIDQIFTAKKLSEQASHTLHVEFIKDDETVKRLPSCVGFAAFAYGSGCGSGSRESLWPQDGGRL